MNARQQMTQKGDDLITSLEETIGSIKAVHGALAASAVLSIVENHKMITMTSALFAITNATTGHDDKGVHALLQKAASVQCLIDTSFMAFFPEKVAAELTTFVAMLCDKETKFMHDTFKASFGEK